MSSQEMKLLIKKIDQMQDTMHFMNEKFEATLKELIASQEENLKYRVLTDTRSNKVVKLEAQVNEL